MNSIFTKILYFLTIVAIICLSCYCDRRESRKPENMEIELNKCNKENYMLSKETIFYRDLVNIYDIASVRFGIILDKENKEFTIRR